MASQDIFKPMHDKLFENFISQDTENGYFDVCFDIGGNLLHAHKNILAAVSKPFDVMFADRWTKKDAPVELTGYSFDDYKEFLTFIYSGSCELDDNNILSLLDMAECYDIAAFKCYCDAYLAKKTFSSTNVFQYVEFARRYSLVKLNAALKKFLTVTFGALFETDDFMNCKKSTVEAFVDYVAELGETENEICFCRVLEWAQKRAEAKMNESNTENFDLQNGIKNELSGILSQFKFSKMSLLFLNETVVKHSYLFSGEELSNLLLNSRKIVVTVTNPQDCILTGVIPYDQEIYNVLSPIRNCFTSITFVSNFDGWISNTQPMIPTKQSLKKNDEIPFYLIIRNHFICILPTSWLRNTDYLIAEMNTDDGFSAFGKCHLNVSTNF